MPAIQFENVSKRYVIHHARSQFEDAMRGAGMPEGEYILGNKNSGLKAIVEDGVAKLPDRSSFAGSVATTDRLVWTMINMANVSVTDAVRMMSHTPARIMKVADRKGSLAVGKDADIVIFDEDVNIRSTIIKGNLIFDGAVKIPKLKPI